MEWVDFYLTAAGAAAALTGLLFVAVSLRPAEIRRSPRMAGRARAAFYAFVTVVFASLLALAGTESRLVGVAQLGVAVAVVALSAPFTLTAARARHLNYARAAVYHAGLVVVAVAGILRAAGADARDHHATLGIGVLLLLAVALSNAWQLVLTHEPSEPHEPSEA